ncbi:MAG TPA: CBS domain-containing protein, partial [Planctomycetota bacterium]|nr:CBS domain-containing protein [Planctomycetota bacterium]
VHSDEWMRDNRLLDSSTITVQEVLRGKRSHIPTVVSIRFDETVDRALALIREFNISQLPVIKDGAMVGVVTEGALLQKVLEGSAKGDARIEYLIEKALPTIPTDAHLPRVMKVLQGSNAAVAVDANGKPVGILTRFDLIEYITT